MATPAYAYWVCDMDGTLVGVDPSHRRRVLEDVADRLGVSFTREDRLVLWFGMGGQRDARLRDLGVEPDRFWAAFNRVEDPASRAEAAFLYDDAEAFVGGLDGPVGLLTHCQRPFTEAVLDGLDIADWFDAVVCCSAETGWKPDPGPVERVLGEMGVPSGDGGVMVGDDAVDVGAAWNAGLDAIHVERHGPARRGHCVVGDRRVESLAALV